MMKTPCNQVWTALAVVGLLLVAGCAQQSYGARRVKVHAEARLAGAGPTVQDLRLPVYFVTRAQWLKEGEALRDRPEALERWLRDHAVTSETPADVDLISYEQRMLVKHAGQFHVLTFHPTNERRPVLHLPKE
jgi:hypothetical protein